MANTYEPTETIDRAWLAGLDRCRCASIEFPSGAFVQPLKDSDVLHVKKGKIVVIEKANGRPSEYAFFVCRTDRA